MNLEKKSKLWTVVRASSGNFLEMYDFQVFGYYAAAIAYNFFPSRNQYASLMLSLTTFGAGFLMRPLGGVFLGTYIDHRGRRAGLLLTLGLMALGTASIALMPSYFTIGLIAPLLVVVGRLCQGLSAGAEVGGVSVYLTEIASPGRKGFYASWQGASQQVAVMFASVMGVALTARFTPLQMAAWGWRIPLLIGCLIVPLLLLLRRSLQETDEFLGRKHHPTPNEIIRTLGRNWRLVSLGAMLSVVSSVTFYMITAYTPTFGTAVLHLDSKASMIVTLCVGASNFFWLPVIGGLSDRIGRRPILVSVTILTFITAYPAFSWLVGAPSPLRLLAVDLWFSFLFGSYFGTMCAFLTEVMPVEIRTTGFAVAHGSATALFGGFTPAISTYMIHATGNRAFPGLWLAVTAGCSLLAAVLLREWQPENSRARYARVALGEGDLT